jgi:CubicO group peptidase (beta-lactamase class C family)
MNGLVRTFLVLWLGMAAQLSSVQASPDSEPFPAHRVDIPAAEALAAQVRENLPQVRSLMVDRAGVTLVEYHRSGVAADDPHYVRSITKSVTATLIGIALGQGLLPGLDVPVQALLPELVEGEGAASQAGAVTLSQLLTMTAGFRWDDRTFHRRRWLMQPDQLRAAVQRPVVRPHGALFNYDTPSTHLLSAVLAQHTGGSTARFAQRALFEPLGIASPRWDHDTQGNAAGGHGLHLGTADLVKLGRLYLQRGRWNGRQLVPESFIDQATTPRVSSGNSGQGAGYGYLWWIRQTPDRRHAFAALGYGGQVLYVVPSLDLVVAMTSDAESRSAQNLPFVENVVLPLVGAER